MDKNPVVFQIYNPKFKVITKLEFGPNISEALRHYLAVYQNKEVNYDDGKYVPSTRESIF